MFHCVVMKKLRRREEGVAHEWKKGVAYGLNKPNKIFYCLNTKKRTGGKINVWKHKHDRSKQPTSTSTSMSTK